ncbi:hypothetical protein [Methylococcus geothermalis]|uniref:Uncharacterized protein n=1 Tax=Methylococcus geothermalis TaxID=2681310 RepID=A0A858Q5Z6_9GAMM|nr:hypothetical protein [Methylococcus geothermalis]QJD29241.1 hypothetical protein GNH96_04155 [Methylococcus geothermalis]
MIGAIAVLFVAYWFYRTALRLKLPPVAWAAGGVIVYYAGFVVWLYLVLKPLLGDSFRHHTFLLGLGMDLSSVLVGTLLAALFRAKVMSKQGDAPYEKHF